jgi:LRP1 type putative zinc finger protein
VGGRGLYQEPHAEELWGAGGGKAKEIGGQQQQQQQQLVVAGGAGTVVTGTGSTACQECGNQAKKDCSYQRCRTCCKSRGFECSTHLKSTWVPAAKRRERQAAESAAAASSGLLRSKSKRARTLVANVANSLTTTSATSPRGSDLNSAHLTATHPSQPASSKGGLPPEVRAQALFKCVRLMGVEDGENEFAYQATVKIGGHIFKGVLYDQGVDNGQAAVPSLGELQLGGNRGGMPSSSALIDPSTLYVSGSALLGGQPLTFLQLQ